MAQISRPFQIALAVVALLALVWVVALHRSSSSSESTSAGHAAAVASAPAKTASAPAAAGKSSGSGAGIYHGSAPGVEGLTRAIAKAHGAVATSQQNAKQLAEKSEQASSAGAPASTSAAAGASAAPSSTHAASAPARTTTTSAPTATRTAAPKLAPHRLAHIPVLARQRLVEAELKQGKVVALLFWSSKGSDDVAVKNALSQLSGRDHRLAVHIAAAGQVASFGTITRGVQVFGTPTILLVGKHGRTIVLTGLQDAYAIQQAVAEARHA
jgi:hypothetical protein